MEKELIYECLNNFRNKFELVLILVKVAKEISNGKIKVDEYELKDKVTKIAFQEILKKNKSF